MTPIAPDPVDPSPRRRVSPVWIVLGILFGAALGVCAIGAYFLLPFLRGLGARRLAANHLNDLTQAILIYADDSDGFLPPADGWMDRVTPFTSVDTNAFKDPELHDPKGFGFALLDSVAGRPLGSFESPDNQVLVFQSTKTKWNAVASLDEVPKPGRTLFRRRRGNLYGLASGRIRFRRD